MNAYEALWTFFVFSFLGWCCEVIFAAFKSGKFVNRGFLFGPVCPIYGMGVVAVAEILKPIGNQPVLEYLVCVIVPTVIEYLLGVISYRVLHERLWDYSRLPLNIGGHVCLLFSVIWGFGAMLIVDYVQPLNLKLLHLLPVWLGWVLIGLFSAAWLTDFILTGLGVLKLPKMWKAAEEMEKALRQVSDSIGEGLSDKALELRERELERLPQQLEKLEKMHSTMDQKHKEAMERADAAAERFRALSERSRRTYHHISEAFPNLRRSKSYNRTKRLQEIYAKWKKRGGEPDAH